MHPGGGVQSSGGSMGSPKPGRKSSWDRDRAGEGGERASQRSSPWTFHGAEELDLSSQSFLWGLEWIVLSWDRVLPLPWRGSSVQRCSTGILPEKHRVPRKELTCRLVTDKDIIVLTTGQITNVDIDNGGILE